MADNNALLYVTDALFIEEELILKNLYDIGNLIDAHKIDEKVKTELKEKLTTLIEDTMRHYKIFKKMAYDIKRDEEDE